MSDLRLRPIPLRERVDPAQVLDIGDAALLSRVEGVLEGFDAGKVLADEIGRLPELVALAEELEPVFLELDPRNAGHESNGQNAKRAQKNHAAGHDEPAQTIKIVRSPLSNGANAHGQVGQDCGQESHRKQKREQRAEGHHVAHDLKRRHLREVQAEKTDRRRDRREEDRPNVELHGMNRCLLAVHSLAKARQHCFYDVHGMRDRDRHQHEDGSSAFAEQRHAGPAYETDSSDDDGNDHQDDRNSSPDRAQHQYGNQQHDPERDGSEELKFFIQRVAHGTIEGELAGDVVVDGRMLRPAPRRQCRRGSRQPLSWPTVDRPDPREAQY